MPAHVPDQEPDQVGRGARWEIGQKKRKMKEKSLIWIKRPSARRLWWAAGSSSAGILNPFPCHFEDDPEVWNPLKHGKKHDFDLISEIFLKCSRYSESRKSLQKSMFRTYFRIIWKCARGSESNETWKKHDFETILINSHIVLKMRPRPDIKENLLKISFSSQFSYHFEDALQVRNQINNCKNDGFDHIFI